MVVACFTILPVMHLCAGVGVVLRYAPELAAEATDTPAGPEDALPETEAEREEAVSDLWAAARAGDVDGIRRFVEEGADVSGRDLLQLTPLHWAATADHAAACDLLVDLGADLEARDACARFIAFTAVARRPDVVEGADVEVSAPDLAALVPHLMTADEVARLRALPGDPHAALLERATEVSP